MSIRWYYTTHRWSYGDPDGYGIVTKFDGSPVNGLIATPILYNDILYGTINNPIYGVDSYGGLVGGPTYRYFITPDIYLENSNLQTSEKYVDLNNVVGIIKDEYDVVTDGSFITDDDCEDVTITGKWRSKQIWNSQSLKNVGYYYLNLVYSLTLKNGNTISGFRMGLDYISDHPYFTIVNNNGEKYTLGKDYGTSPVYDTTGTNLENSMLDFGTTKQHCPKFFKNRIERFFDRIYENTYSIKNNDGSVITQITEQPPIIRTDLISAGNAYQLAFTGENGIVQTLNWEMETPENKRFIGLSNVPNGVVLIPLGEQEISIENSTSFYPVFIRYRPLVTSFQIKLYKNTAEYNRVDKTNYLTDVGTISGVMREASSITDLTITIERADLPNFNYVYIEKFSRYYFVNDIRIISNELFEIDMSVDVLMSYKDAIKSLQAFVDRAQNFRNPYIIDKKMVIQQGFDIVNNTVANQVFDEIFNYDTSVRFVMNGYKLNVRPGIL